jgi:hypothetical protein
MSGRPRHRAAALSLAALLAVQVTVPVVGAQSADPSPALAAPVVAQPTPAAEPTLAAEPVATTAPETPRGPTRDAARAGIAPLPATAEGAEGARQQRAPRAGVGQPVALMVVGLAAIVVGAAIGGAGGTALAVGGAVVGLAGLYQFLR